MRHLHLLKISRDRFAPCPLAEQLTVQLNPLRIQKIEVLSITAKIDDARDIQHPVTQLDRDPITAAKRRLCWIEVIRAVNEVLRMLDASPWIRRCCAVRKGHR